MPSAKLLYVRLHSIDIFDNIAFLVVLCAISFPRKTNICEWIDVEQNLYN